MGSLMGETGIGEAIEQGKKKNQEKTTPQPATEEPKKLNEKMSQEDKDFYKWCGVIDRHPEVYYGLNSDCAIIKENVSPEVFQRLAEKFEGIKAYIDERKTQAEEGPAIPIIDKELFYTYDKNDNIKGISIDKFTEYLLTTFDFKTIYGMKSENIYFFEDGIWKPKGRKIIKTEAERVLGEWCKNNLIMEVVEKIKRQTAIDIEDFNQIPEGLICLENCVLDLNKNKTLKHSPEHFFKTKLPLTHDPKAECPAIEKFFSEVLYPEDIPLIQEWFGYHLYNSYFEKKAVILFGDTDTGKTICLNLLNTFIGERNRTGLSLQKITIGKSFDIMHLKDKYANTYDDLSSKDLSDNGGFKIATGGGSISGEQKFGDHIEFKTFAKLTFATNKIPPVKDIDDNAYYKRWLPIAFDNQIKEKDQNKTIIQDLTTSKELSGLLNYAIKGLLRLRKNNGFSFNKSISEVKGIMQRSSHPLAMFCQDCLELKPGNKISKDDMFEAYSTWCIRENNSPSTKDQVGKQLSRFMLGILAAKSGGERYWLNAKLKEEFEPTEKVNKQKVL